MTCHTATPPPLTAAACGYSSAFDSEVKPQEPDSPVSLRRETLFAVKWDGVTRQAASELRRGLEPAGWRDVDWQPSPQTPTRLWPSNGCSSRVMRVLFSTVGRPIPVQRTPHPTPEQTEQLHQTYVEELRKLFDEHKGKYGIPEHQTLVFK